VEKGGPAEKAGILAGDKIIQINGKTMNGFGGSLDSIRESIILSKGKQIEFTVERAGSPGPIKCTSEFVQEDTKWFQRKGVREVGLTPQFKSIVLAVSKVGKGSNPSPAMKAGFKDEDVLVSINGQTFLAADTCLEYVRSHNAGPINFEILRDKKPMSLTITPALGMIAATEEKKPMLGLIFGGGPYLEEGIVNPNPFEQVGDSLRQMWTTITSVIASDSSIGIGHLSGPVGIANLQYQLLQMKDGWRRILSFMVLFNVNLAVLNMMPFPVLDGGHILLAILEKITGRPVKAKPLEILQTACALGLMTLMLYVTSKDIGDKFGHDSPKASEVIFQ
jgi:regulator of sigma E protease